MNQKAIMTQGENIKESPEEADITYLYVNPTYKGNAPASALVSTGSGSVCLQRECPWEAIEEAACRAACVSADTCSPLLCWHLRGLTSIVKMDDGYDSSYLLVVLGLTAAACCLIFISYQFTLYSTYIGRGINMEILLPRDRHWWKSCMNTWVESLLTFGARDTCPPTQQKYNFLCGK